MTFYSTKDTRLNHWLMEIRCSERWCIISQLFLLTLKVTLQQQIKTLTTTTLIFWTTTSWTTTPTSYFQLNMHQRNLSQLLLLRLAFYPSETPPLSRLLAKLMVKNHLFIILVLHLHLRKGLRIKPQQRKLEVLVRH